MGEQTETTPAKKPRLAVLLATGFGLGYLPVAPGTWGSLGGIILSIGLANVYADRWLPIRIGELNLDSGALVVGLMTTVIALRGVWAAGQAARYFGKSDPAQVVIDEISGQQITYLPVMPSLLFPGGWKYVVLGFVLFRVFDIVKPWPIRRLEKLPGGWGIMADDWLAGAYAAVVLLVVRWSGWLG